MSGDKASRWSSVEDSGQMYRKAEIDKFCMDGDSPIVCAVERMNENRLGIVLVVDERRRLIGTVTDGDVRRTLMTNVDLHTPVTYLLERKVGSLFESPIVAPAGRTPAEYLKQLQENQILYLPIVDGEGCVIGLLTTNDLIDERTFPLRAVIMAGGEGMRLRPLTEDVPKPMLPVGNRPLLELIIEQLRDAGIRKVNITTHYKSEKITEHFGDGSTFGVELNYVSEERPLGTAGALGLIEVPEEPLLVINGDILTRIDFRAMLAYHQEHQADLTIAVRKYDLKIPYGVIECDGTAVRKLREKPVMNFFVNAGIYLLQPGVYRFIDNGERLDMTDLIQRLLDDDRSVVSFPVLEYWLDIGQLADYERAQNDIREGKL